MMIATSHDMEARGAFPRFSLEPAVSAAEMCANARSALARGLPEVRRCKPHGHVMEIAAGGPSLADTAGDLTGYVAAMNGSLRYLLQRGIVPHACGVLDPGAHMADIVEADPRVRYYVASVVHPSVLDKLTRCHVTLWHPAGTPGLEDIVAAARPDTWLMIGGGSTMGVRWLNLAYVLGFRAFRVHGLDSSFRDGATHAYPDRADGKRHFEFMGRTTRPNFMAQVSDFLAVMHNFARSDMDPVTVEVKGDGLLQDIWREHADVRGADCDRREAAKYRRMWDIAGYRAVSPGEALAGEIAAALDAKPGASVIDFGIGTGRCAQRLKDLGLAVTGIDIADNCLDDGVDIPVTIAPLWRLPAGITADHGVCCDVMEHIPPDRVDDVLSGMAQAVRRNVYFHIALEHDACGQWIGAPLHLTVRPHAWWCRELANHWRSVTDLGPGRFVVGSTTET